MSERRPGFLGRLIDWFTVETPGDDQAGSAPGPQQAPGTASTPRAGERPVRGGATSPKEPGSVPGWRWLLVSLAAAAVVVLGVRAAASLGGTGASQPGPPTRTATRATQSAATTTANADPAATARANVTAVAAQREATDAQQDSQRIAGLLTGAERDANQIQTLAAPAAARKPGGKDPGVALRAIQQAHTEATDALGSIATDATNIAQARDAVRRIMATDTAAADAGGIAKTAVQTVQAALASARSAVVQIGSLEADAARRVKAWKAIHDAPPGVLGVQVKDAPADWTVRGCEVIAVTAGSAAQTIGLVGASTGGNGVGDVITAIADATDGHAVWPTLDCKALQQAMAQTRSGDHLTVNFRRRLAVDQVFGTWQSRAGSAVLGPHNVASCPPPLTGRITSAQKGSRIALVVNLRGTLGQRDGLAAILDTGGVATYFPDALLRGLGYRPYASQVGAGIVPGAAATVFLYHMSGSALTVDDHGQPAPLATGTLDVVGIPNGQLIGLGPDILKHGAKLSTANRAWSLTPPCSAGGTG